MLQFAKRYVLALLCLLVAMGGYTLFVVPAIEPPSRGPKKTPAFAGVLAGRQWWQSLFPAESWQRDQPQILQSKRGMVLLSKQWLQLGPKTLQLKPLTMILPQSAARGDEASAPSLGQDVIVINAEQGAVIHFEQAIDPGGAIPSVERGLLNGQIIITREIAGADNPNPWSVRTSELSIDRNRISTQQDVLIEWPDAVIAGHDMKLTLQGDLLGAGDTESSPWGPLRTLELYHIDRIDMGLAPGGMWADVELPLNASLSNESSPQLRSAGELKSLPARLRMVCGGRFTFDFTRSRGTLVGGVHVLHQLGKLPADEFLSQEVVLDIEPPQRSSPLSKETANLELAGITLKQLEATGIDPLEDFVGERKVEIKSPLLGAYAAAKRLRLNFSENRIELDGKLSHPGATQSTAWLEYQGYHFTAPRIDYDADGSGTSRGSLGPDREHLGYLVATGAGEMRLPVDSSLGRALVRWQDSLEMRPTQEPGLQWVGLFGNVLVESLTHGYMACDDLEVWLRKKALRDRLPLPQDQAAQSRAAPDYLPERLRSTGKTSLDTRQIRAEVEQLSANFSFVETAAPAAGQDPTSALSLSDSMGNPMHQWLQPPADSAAISTSPASPQTSTAPLAAAPLSPTASSPAPMRTANAQSAVTSSMTPATGPANEPITVRGRHLTANLIVAGEQSWVDNLTVGGPLEVVGTVGSPQASKFSNPPNSAWRVVGDELQMATNPRGQVDLQVAGRPAQITLAEGSLKGPNIRFDQKSNLIWMDQPGEFTIPTSVLASAGTGRSSVNWFEPPYCSWKGQMLFDGRSVRIVGDIHFKGAMRLEGDQFWWISGRAEELQMELSEAVNLGDLRNATTHAASVTVSQNVNILASQLDSRGNKKSRQQLQLPSLTYDIVSNEIIGLGPGSIRSWHLTDADDQPGRLAAAGGTLGTGAPGAENLQGAHLVFLESMRGFLNRSEVYFQGKVELAAGPLRDWDDAIDLANMRQLSVDQMHLDCDLLKVYDTSGLSSNEIPGVSKFATGDAAQTSSWEFQAKGNVNFAGKSESGDYEGSGSAVTYAQAKELLMLWGEPKRPATIISKQRADDGGPAAGGTLNLSVAYAAINPKTLAIERWELGQNGVRFDMPGSANPLGASGQPPINGLPLPAPNPRSTVSDFFQRR